MPHPKREVTAIVERLLRESLQPREAERKIERELAQRGYDVSIVVNESNAVVSSRDLGTFTVSRPADELGGDEEYAI